MLKKNRMNSQIQKFCRMTLKGLIALTFIQVVLPVVESMAQQSEVYLAPIRVKGTSEKQEVTQLKSPTTFVVKTEEEIAEKQPLSLSETLKGTPGVNFVGGPRSTAELPQIRGFSGNRILVLIDGARQNFESGHNGKVLADVELLKSVEVLKGSSSALYGNNAIGGVLKLKRKQASDFTDGKVRTGVEFSAQGSSVNEGGKGRVTAFSNQERSGVMVSVVGANSNDVKSGGNGDKISNSASQHQSVLANTYFTPRPHSRIEASFEQFNEQADWPFNPQFQESADPRQPNPISETDKKRSQAQLSYSYRPTKVLNLESQIYWNHIDVEKKTESLNNHDNLETETFGMELRNSSNFALSNDASNLLNLVYGAEFYTDKNDGSRVGEAGLGAYPDGRSEHLGLFFQPAYEKENFVRVVPSIRYDQFQINIPSDTSYNKKDSQWTGKLGVVGEITPENSVFVSYGQAYSAPKIQDVYPTGQHFPGNFFVPNPDLEPELSETAEIGVKHASILPSGFSLETEASLFRTSAKNQIRREVISRTVTRYENVERSRTEGAEVSAALTSGLTRAALTFMAIETTDLTKDEPLSNEPADSWQLSLSRQVSEKLKLKFGTDVNISSEQTQVPDKQDSRAAFMTQDIFVNYEAEGFGGKKFNVGLRVNNLFDEEYSPVSFDVPAPGRDFRLSLSVRL